MSTRAKPSIRASQSAAAPATVMVSGSVAFDSIMVFEGHFKDHILPDRVQMLSVSFLTPRMKKVHGGCAANIAYNIAGLGGKALILATVGSDGDDYVARLAGLGIDTRAIQRIEDAFTPQCFITTDLADNQITAFHPGAMSFAHQVSARAAAAHSGAQRHIGIVGPNGKDAMVQHAREFADCGIPFVFDPGQGMPMFDGEELRSFIAQASAVTVNDYESGMLTDRTGWSEDEIASRVEALIVTKGAEGSVLYTDGATHAIPAAKATVAVDPTGCGDAYRGGLLWGLARGWSWPQAARLGSVLGSIKVEQEGPQSHALDVAAIQARAKRAYGEVLPLQA